MVRRVRYEVIGSPVDLISWSDAISRIEDWGQQRLSKIVCICNVHMVVTARSDRILRSVLLDADMVTPDGAPVAWVLARGSGVNQSRINGPDLMTKYLRLAETSGQVISFYGGSKETVARLDQQLRHEFPALKIGVMISPPYREMSEGERQEDIRKINESGTSVLFVGLGCPKQEKWMQMQRGKVNAVMVGVGAAFDYHARTIKRAPLWMQRYGLEWLYRLISEPRRLWRRYLLTNSVFLAQMSFRRFRAKMWVA